MGFEGLADGLGDEASHGAFLPELHLALGGVDVHVHGGGVDVEEEAADGVAALHEGGVIALDQGVVEAAVLDGATVDEEVLLVAGGARDAGGADEPPEVEVAGRLLLEDGGGVGVRGGIDPGFKVHDEPLGGPAVEDAESLAQGLETFRGGGGRTWWQFPHEAPLVGEGETHAGMCAGCEGEVMLDVGALGLLGAQELPSRGQVEEEGTNLHGGAGGIRGGLDLGDPAALDQDGGGLAVGVVVLPGDEMEAADAGDGGQGLPAEAHGGDGGEVLGPLDLGRGVAFQAEQCVVPGHAHAIVGHADQAAAAGRDLDGDAGWAGVDGVLDELLDDGGGSLDDLAGRDLVGDVVGQEADAIHGGARWWVDGWAGKRGVAGGRGAGRRGRDGRHGRHGLAEAVGERCVPAQSPV